MKDGKHTGRVLLRVAKGRLSLSLSRARGVTASGSFRDHSDGGIGRNFRRTRTRARASTRRVFTLPARTGYHHRFRNRFAELGLRVVRE